MATVLAFKGNLPNITLLKIYDPDIAAIDAVLKTKKRGAPLMMVGLQVIIDVTECSSSDIDIAALKQSLMNEGVMPVAVMSENFSLATVCVAEKLGFIPPYKRESQPVLNPSSEPENTISEEESNNTFFTDIEKSETSAVTSINTAETSTVSQAVTHAQPSSPIENIVLTRQIRSGQRIYAKGDLTIVGSVSAGAEVIADGNIHIYGALRGRALAGASGDETAAIFCQDFAAELVSIAGFYIGAVDVDSQYANSAVQISLNGEKFKFYRL